MLLKEIKPGMVVHCKNYVEKKELFEEAERLGYKWKTNLSATDLMMNGISGNTIHFHERNEHVSHRYITWSDKTDGATEFSDLIIQELTGLDAFNLAREICRARDDCEACPLENTCYKDTDSNPEDIISILTRYKEDNKKKEPEIETVDICRIIEIQPDGRNRCVHEEHMENIPIEEGKVCPSDRNIQKRCREILKRYCMEHEGEFIAVHEVVSRVKAVE